MSPELPKKIAALIEKGVSIPCPSAVWVGDEVPEERIHGKGTVLFPGTRLAGAKTLIGPGVKLGSESPVTVVDCRLGPGVELKGGSYERSVFLPRSSMGSGAQVREGCLIEEEASGAHTVGLKQTILFPFVTLGSLINFCDCLMAGGTSRRNHSEVGSSYIHFNFTPDGDKTTPSLIGDVPRGVMLNQPPIFLGGQGGLVGPIRMGYGNVVAANSVLRNDFPADNKLIVGKTHSAKTMDVRPGTYPNLHRIMGNNVIYIANLVALEQWYLHVRRPFLEAREFGDLIFSGLMDTLTLAKTERLKRLRMLAEKAQRPEHGARAGKDGDGRSELYERFGEMEGIFMSPPEDDLAGRSRDGFLALAGKLKSAGGADYVETVRGFDTETSGKGTAWLQEIVDTFCGKVQELLPSLNMFGR